MKTTAFKMTELGPIPSDWEVKRFDEVYSFAAAGDLQKEFFSPIHDDNHQYAIFSNGLTNKGLYGYTSRPRYKGDSVTITGRGTLGYAEYREDEFDAIIRLLILSPLGLIDNRFVVYWINFFNPFVNESTSIPQLTVPQVAGTSLFLPPLPEQRRIAAALSDVDDLIGALGKLVEKKRAIKTGAMQRLLTGQTRLPGFGGAEFKQTELGPIPADWEVKRLGEIAEFSTSTVSVSSIDATWYVGTENMLANMKGIVPNKESVPYQTVREYREGDILISNIRPYLKKIWLADHNGGCSTDVLVIRVVDVNSCCPAFLKMLLSSDSFFDFAMANAIGTKMPRGDKKVLINYELVVPHLPEQQAIAGVLSDMDAEIAALEAEKRKVEAIKQGMMQELLTGKTRLKGD